ncbi:MAG: dUTP diphosphatase [Clostridia bacterium]|nr:dUTP diphosphatase [Clostridia bacterium]
MNMKKNVKIRMTRGMPLPMYATPGSAALDLRAALDEGSVLTLQPGERAVVPTGVQIAPEESDTVAIVAARSGLAIRHGITLSNGIGVIDSDYRGEICVGLVNHGQESFTIERGDRIAQLMFLPVYAAVLLPTEDLDATDRGAGGFGSTGVK